VIGIHVSDGRQMFALLALLLGQSCCELTRNEIGHHASRNPFNLLTYLLTPCRTIILEKPTGFQLVKYDPKKIQFLPYGRSIGSWICLTHKTYTCHTVQNTYSASVAVSDSQSIFRFNLRCLSYYALFRFLSRMRCTSMGVWGSMIY
jgi:hypothetical protein